MLLDDFGLMWWWQQFNQARGTKKERRAAVLQVMSVVTNVLFGQIFSYYALPVGLASNNSCSLGAVAVALRSQLVALRVTSNAGPRASRDTKQ